LIYYYLSVVQGFVFEADLIESIEVFLHNAQGWAVHYPLAFWHRKFHVSHPAKN
jgi:hypothetical protein